MTATTIPNTSTATTRQSVWKHGLAASAAASVATTAIAALAMAAGVTFETDGSPIPLFGFAQLTFIFSLIGTAIAAVLARRARRPRLTFVRTTVVLTVVSLVPDVAFGFDVASAIALMVTHIVAAAIVIPVLARRLAA